MKTLLLFGFWLFSAAFTTAGDGDTGPRYIGHITQNDGGFQTIVIFNNNAPIKKTVQLHAFRTDGTPVSEKTVLTLDGFSVHETTLTDLFPKEAIGHLRISGSNRVMVSVRYQRPAGPAGFTPHLHESSIGQTDYFIYPGSPMVSDYWEGTAIVNLAESGAGDTKVRIAIQTHDQQDLAEHEFVLAGAAKTLRIFRDIFPETENLVPGTFFYRISAGDPIGVTALMGNLKTGDIASAHPASPIQMQNVVRGDFDQIPDRPFELSAADLDEDFLTVDVGFKDSCSFAPVLYWDGNFMESFPEQTHIRIGPQIPAPPCGETENLRSTFDLSLIMEAYVKGTGRLDPIIVHLQGFDGQDYATFTLNGDDVNQ